MGIVNSSDFAIGDGAETRRFVVHCSVTVCDPIESVVAESLIVSGRSSGESIQSVVVFVPNIKVVKQSLGVALESSKDVVHESVSLNAVDKYVAYNSAIYEGKQTVVVSESVTIKNIIQRVAFNSISVGDRPRYVVQQNADISSGDSMLVLADIVEAAIAINTSGESSIQIIDLGGATGGTWAVWLNYNGQILITDDLAFNATALQVQDKLRELSNVPQDDSIVVTGANGGPYTVTFQNSMGGRFISPLIVEFMNLTGGTGASIDIIEPGTPMASFNDTMVSAYLKVNGVEVPIKSFDFQKPDDRLGALLNVTLAIPNPNQVPVGSDVEFAITANGVPKVLVKDGKLSGLNYGMGFRPGPNGGPSDEVTFGALDIVADKASLAPRRPVVMFDPNKVNFKSVETKPRDAVLDENGLAILPIYEYVAGLTMQQILTRAYTNRGGFELMSSLTAAQVAALSGVSGLFNDPAIDQLGLGFDKVITNIKNYQVKEARFSLEAGWHDGAQPVVGMFNPQYLPILNDLYILSIEYKLPFGALPRIVPMSVTSLQVTTPVKADTNAVLLTYQISVNDDPTTKMFLATETDQPEVTDNGLSFGSPGYQETTTTNTYLRKRLFSTLEIVGEVVQKSVVETRVDPDGSGGMTLISRETVENRYDNDLKVGHRRTIEALLLVAKATAVVGTSFPTVLDETCNISWIDDPDSVGQKLQSSSSTITTGLYYKRDAAISVGDEDFNIQYPILLAQSSGILLVDYEADALGETHTAVIKTITETLRHIQGNQYDNVVTEIDVLNKQPKHSVTSPRTGTVGSNPYDMRQKTRLIRDEDSELEIGPRIPIGVNAGELPQDRAIDLANEILNRVKNPLQKLTFNLTKVDFALDKGSVVVGQTRYGYTSPNLVVGLSIKGENLGKQGHSIIMSLNTLELPKIAD